jgi:hypothetical protein
MNERISEPKVLNRIFFCTLNQGRPLDLAHSGIRIEIRNPRVLPSRRPANT